MSHVDIPQLSSSGIEFGFQCFLYTSSLQSSSTYPLILSSFDAPALKLYTLSKSSLISFDLLRLAGILTDMTIPNECFNTSAITSFHLSSIGGLKSIVISDECFGSVRVFELDGLSELESVVIGKKSFRISGSERSDGTCRIVNCAKVKSIQIGYQSFADYHSFELNNLPSLQSIAIGEYCFHYAPSFSLTGLFD